MVFALIAHPVVLIRLKGKTYKSISLPGSSLAHRTVPNPFFTRGSWWGQESFPRFPMISHGSSLQFLDSMDRDLARGRLYRSQSQFTNTGQQPP